jgi:hypothetical protein
MDERRTARPQVVQDDTVGATAAPRPRPRSPRRAAGPPMGPPPPPPRTRALCNITTVRRLGHESAQLGGAAGWAVRARWLAGRWGGAARGRRAAGGGRRAAGGGRRAAGGGQHAPRTGRATTWLRQRLKNPYFWLEATPSLTTALSHSQRTQGPPARSVGVSKAGGNAPSVRGSGRGGVRTRAGRRRRRPRRARVPARRLTSERAATRPRAASPSPRRAAHPSAPPPRVRRRPAPTGAARAPPRARRPAGRAQPRAAPPPWGRASTSWPLPSLRPARSSSCRGTAASRACGSASCGGSRRSGLRARPSSARRASRCRASRSSHAARRPRSSRGFPPTCLAAAGAAAAVAGSPKRCTQAQGSRARWRRAR